MEVRLIFRPHADWFRHDKREATFTCRLYDIGPHKPCNALADRRGGGTSRSVCAHYAERSHSEAQTQAQAQARERVDQTKTAKTTTLANSRLVARSNFAAHPVD